MLFKETKTEITLVHDIDEVSKRSVQFVGAALVVALINIPINIYVGHKLTTIILSSFCVLLIVILFMLKRGYSRYTKALTIAGINVFFILFNFFGWLANGKLYLFFSSAVCIAFPDQQ